jgi:hypothetical protein
LLQICHLTHSWCFGSKRPAVIRVCLHAPSKGQLMIDSMRAFFQRLYCFFRRKRLDSEFDAEMAAHLELVTEENLRRNMTQ